MLKLVEDVKIIDIEQGNYKFDSRLNDRLKTTFKDDNNTYELIPLGLLYSGVLMMCFRHTKVKCNIVIKDEKYLSEVDFIYDDKIVRYTEDDISGNLIA